ncbi:hypothetical protein N7462_009506 [Penicillium macrosclerotiorum]|uniref:uncharacterized protein n=1 Tax=Penicillium macrosclerotiorum TaxID=303699 RepID=UPI002549A21B|nr:uncharacterized protein N7462_009506 [Penicillium macrosclerotiorum]KAJ5674067.1 hypothetical protein N7462_009506 [Penicillium macrosclerotiorum]
MEFRTVPRLVQFQRARSSNRALLNSNRTSRCYSTKKCAPFAYTWLTKSPEAIDPSDILASLPSRPVIAPDSVPLLLLTPSFAHWLDASNLFLADLMRRLYGDTPEPQALHAIAAVVDRIPYGPSLPKGSISDIKKSPTTRVVESEGLSLLVVGPEAVQGKVAPTRGIRGPAGEEPDLMISLQNGEAHMSSAGTAYRVGLRLANTVFTNGKETTLFGMRWARNTTGKYTLQQSVDFASCSVTALSQVDGLTPSLSLPLHPVGERRKVITSMGNILRQISKSSDPNSNEPIPASSELEKDLPRYIEENNIMAQKVSVWALVEKPDVVAADESSTTQDRLIQSLRQGGKLHRVMSGGGGWGKKQGLLSLDPEISFCDTTRRQELLGLDQLFDPNADAVMEMPSLDTKGMIGDDLSLLSQVARAGDFVQFLVSVEPVYPPDASPTHDGACEESITYNFGVVSRADELDSQTLNGEEKNLIPLPNSFGALSEKAIAYAQPVPQGETWESSTKLDIPGCRVILNL